MSRIVPGSILAATLSAAMLITPAHAALFPDVPAGHVYQAAIEALAAKGIVKGNPDGNFAPTRTLNRAEWMTLLYRAKGWKPNPPSTYCFADVQPSVWFSGVICDAAEKGYVTGYSDRKFKPEQEVNRAEALKMLAMVLKIESTEPEAAEILALPYNDIPSGAWFARYVVAAWKKDVIPIAGQEGPTLNPNFLLQRGEGAAYLANALGLTGTQQSSSEESQEEPKTITAQTTSTKVVDKPVQRSVNFPFRDDGMFPGKKAVSYTFTLKDPVVADISTTLTSGDTSKGLSCRLYRLAADGFSLEYYLGNENGKECLLLVKLQPGSYQLEVQSRSADASYSVDAKSGTGDGNDGFSEAKTLIIGTPKVGVLTVDDLSDWYVLSLSSETKMILELISDRQLGCLIYPMSDVDLFGFSGPECNSEYLFPKGTYYIGVSHLNGRLDKQSYTVRAKK